MQYQYEMDIYGHSMQTHPQETKTGTIQLENRPMVGDEIQVEGVWHKIETVRHTSDGMLLKLADYYPNRR